MFGVFCAAKKSQAAIIYVDNSSSMTSDCTSGNYSIANHNCSGTDGNAYNTLKDVVWGTNGTNGAAKVGDTIYLRGGTYSEMWGSTGMSGAAMQIPTSLNGTSWTAGNYTTISSYPGEWAKITGDNVTGDYRCLFGYGDEGQGIGVGGYKYWVIERLEFTGGAKGNIAIKYGPVKVRYCYIHDNVHLATGNDIYAGINMRNGTGNIIEYNYFYNNGDPNNPTSNNNSHISNYSDYMYDDVLAEGTARYNWDHCNRDNEIRYNYFVNGTCTQNSIRDKASQYLTDFNTLGSSGLPTADMTNKEHGNKIHHNISLGVPVFAFHVQDFEQIYNNITNGGICPSASDGSTTHWHSLYNNTVLGARIGDQPDNDDNGKYTTMDKALYMANNILVNGITYGDYNIADSWNSNEPNVYTYTWTNTRVDKNLLYKPSDNYDFLMPNKAPDILTSDFNAARGTTNYRSSADGLFLNTSGADKYKISASFSDGLGSHNAGNAGQGETHPYLSVSIPSYLGAVNPNDSGWVDDVLSFADMSNEIPTNLRDSLVVDLDDGEVSSGDQIPPANPTGLSIS